MEGEIFALIVEVSVKQLFICQNVGTVRSEDTLEFIIFSSVSIIWVTLLLQPNNHSNSGRKKLFIITGRNLKQAHTLMDSWIKGKWDRTERGEERTPTYVSYNANTVIQLTFIIWMLSKDVKIVMRNEVTPEMTLGPLWSFRWSQGHWFNTQPLWSTSYSSKPKSLNEWLFLLVVNGY